MTISRNLSILAEGVSSTGVLSAAFGGALAWQSVQTGNFTAVAGNSYLVNTTSGAVTVTLPASPTAGQSVQVSDYAGTFATNACTIARNGSNIGGQAINSTLNVARESIAFVYADSTQGWVAYSAFVATSLGQGYTASYLVVAGGGGGAPGKASTWEGGGGGAGGANAISSGTGGGGGGYVEKIYPTPSATYTYGVGSGGAGGPAGTGGAAGGAGAGGIIIIEEHYNY